jgi:DNA-directed RNA polymerase subunit K/omega
VEKKELKKRNADQMEIDDGLDIMKKARMEIDEKLLNTEVVRENNNNKPVDAGLPGQPGEAQ